MQRYHCTPLNRFEPSAFRIVELLPRANDDTLRGIIHHVPLDRTPGYLALSYVWSQEVSKPNPGRILLTDVHLDGEYFLNTTQNLYEALIHFRHENESKAVWIDAICINQDDDEEKSYQVGRMAEIYSQAEIVLIWLGPSNQAWKRGLQLAQDLSQLHLTRQAAAKGTQEGYWLWKQPEADDNRFSWSNQQDGWVGLYELLASAPWFTCIWIIQEVALARSAFLTVGNFAVPWKVLSLAMRAVIDGTVFCPYVPCREIVSQKQAIDVAQYLSSRSSTLLDFLGATSQQDAKDERDKIFALLGMIKNWGNPGTIVRPDYKLDMKTLCQCVSRHHIIRHQSLTFLCGLHESARRWSAARKYGSWVHDWGKGWNCRNRVSPLNLGSDRLPCFRASGSAQASFKTSGDVLELIVKSGVIDTIAFTGGAFWERLTDTSSMHPFIGRETVEELKRHPWLFLGLMRDEFLEWVQLAIKHGTQAYPPGEPRIRALWRTMLNDCYPEGTRSLKNEEAHILSDIRRSLDELRKDSSADDLISFGSELEDYIHNIVECQSINPDGQESWLKRWVRMKSQDFTQNYPALYVQEKFFITKKGYYGTGSSDVLPQDNVCILVGAPSPFVLRDMSSHFELIGECYLHGFMDGEGMDNQSICFKDIVLR